MSIPANIVEGRGQLTGRDFARFLRYGLNSSSELEYHLIVARDIRAITERDFRSLTDQIVDVRKMLYGLTKILAKQEDDASAAHAVRAEFSEQR